MSVDTIVRNSVVANDVFTDAEIQRITWTFVVKECSIKSIASDSFIVVQTRTYPYLDKDVLELKKVHEGYLFHVYFAVPFTRDSFTKYFPEAQIMAPKEIKCEIAQLSEVFRYIDLFASYKFIRPDVPNPFARPTSSGANTPEQTQTL